MSAQTSGEQVVARIGFAQRWLDRAKHQYTEGHLARSALTLVLADAEVRHALEATGAPTKVQTRRMTPVALMALCAVLVSTFLLVSRWPTKPGAPSSPPPVMVTLSSSSGALLEAMDTVTAGSRTVPVSTIAGSAFRSGSGLDARKAFPSPNVLDEAQVQPARSSISPVVMGSSHLSMSELIDLVLTAERALRQEPAGSSSP